MKTVKKFVALIPANYPYENDISMRLLFTLIFQFCFKVLFVVCNLKLYDFVLFDKKSFIRDYIFHKIHMFVKIIVLNYDKISLNISILVLEKIITIST